MKTALVTGSGGFAGRHFVEALEDCGFCVLGIDPADERATQEDALQFFEFDRRRQGPDLVVHCAAVVGGRAVIDREPLAQAVNLQLDAAMFRWALRTRPGRVVYVSSSAAYPVAVQQLPHEPPCWDAGPVRLSEDMIDPSFRRSMAGVPDQLYGWAKLTGENLAHRARQEDLNVTVVRPFSGYGEDQDLCYPFRAFAERARVRQDPFEIWGSARQVRDFIHISDIVAATLLMCQEGIDGPVNLGSGDATSLGDLAGMFCREAGYRPDFAVDAGAPMGVGYRVADTTLLNTFYKPKVSLEEGVRRALA